MYSARRRKSSSLFASTCRNDCQLVGSGVLARTQSALSSSSAFPCALLETVLDEMTMSWCQKRAELVYKCIKGFMMEMSSWGGAEMKNMQFLVPKGISEELFQHLASMLPNIFRVSNPLVVKSS
ncbi:Protein C12orf4 [Chionoecetes opilio]|uniref:Protein C12orf4 n=1 Tax=Chionoecetes opilio TaxID=41210 RepID=A0A8J5D3F3_CHIOP|nr:Protein C12orf4 [Chionoecetes opilio]